MTALAIRSLTRRLMRAEDLHLQNAMLAEDLEAQKEALRKFAETMGEVAPSSSEEGESKSVFHRRKKK